MLPRLYLFRKSSNITASLPTLFSQSQQRQKRHHTPSVHAPSASSQSLQSSFAIAAFGLTVFSLSTFYAFQNRKSKVTAQSLTDGGGQGTTPKADGKPKLSKCPQWDWNWDHRHHLVHSRPGYRTKATRSYTLIRHGQYVHDPDPDRKILTALGREQAKVAGLKLKASGIEFDDIICSEMVRAKETASIITSQLYPHGVPVPIEYDGDLNEGAPAFVEPARDDLDKSGFYDDILVDSERISRAFESHIHRSECGEDEEILIIGHGNVFRYFMCRVLQFPPEAWLRFAICNCGITKFRVFGDGRVSVDCIGSDGHFTQKQRTFN